MSLRAVCCLVVLFAGQYSFAASKQLYIHRAHEAGESTITVRFVPCATDPIGPCNAALPSGCGPDGCAVSANAQQPDAATLAAAIVQAVNTAGCTAHSATNQGSGRLLLTYPDDRCLCITDSGGTSFPLHATCNLQPLCEGAWIVDFGSCADECGPASIGYGSFGPDAVELHFDELVQETTLTDAYGGLLFENAGVKASPDAASPTIDIRSIDHDYPIRINFDPPIIMVGCRIDRDGFTGERQPQIRAFSADGRVEVCSFGQSPDFRGFASTAEQPIVAVELGCVRLADCAWRGSDAFDDLIYEYAPGVGGDPGVVAVLLGDLAPLTWTLPAGTPYQLVYDVVREQLWFDSQRQRLANALTTYLARDKGDFNADGAVNGDDLAGFVAAWVAGSPVDARADFDDSSSLDETDVREFVEAALAGFPGQGVVLYVEAQGYSTALGDAPVSLWLDPDQDNIFTEEASTPVTLLAIDCSGGGGLGSLAQFRLVPSGYPLAFNNATKLSWQGEARVLFGQPVPLSIDFNAGQVFNASPAVGYVALGDGTRRESVSEQDIFRLNGEFRGRATIDFGPGLRVRTPLFQVDATGNDGQLCHIEYPDGPGGLDAPRLWFAPSQIIVLMLSNLPGDPPDEARLLMADGFHFAATVRIDENNYTTAHAPDHMTVDVISYNSQGVEIDRIAGLVLDKITYDDEDPAHIVYASDLYRPIILVDMDLDEQDYPNILFLKQDGNDAGARVRVIPRLFQGGGAP